MLLLSLVLVRLFVWFVDNIGTYTHVWMYPHQVRGWSVAGPGKIGVWFLLMLISYALATWVSGVRRSFGVIR